MNAAAQPLTPALELARADPVRYPTKAPNIAPPAPRCWPRRSSCAATSSASPRSAARCRRAARCIGDYRFEGEDGPTDFAGLFGDKQTLVVYSYMFGPERERPCPMCTNLLERLGRQRRRHRPADLAGRRRPLADRAPDRLEARARLEEPAPLQRSQRRLFARLFRHPARRLGSPGPQRVHPPRRDDPPFLVGRDDRPTADPGQDPRGAPDPAPLWDGAGPDAGRARRRLVSQARVRLSGALST